MKLIIANWKMNPKTEGEALALAKASDMGGLVIVPPFIFMEGVRSVLKNAELGAPDVFWEGSGPYTGEVSAEELKSLGVKYVIVGHSERRALGETDRQVAQKVHVVLENGMTPVLCVGESAAERAASQTEEVIERQLRLGLSLISNRRPLGGAQGKPATSKMDGVVSLPIIHVALPLSLVIAYEPLWAIGTGTPNTPQDTIKMVQYIHRILAALNLSLVARVLYGGSVDSANAESFLKEKEIDGALVGGASLKPDQIKKIVAIAKKQ